MFGGLSLPIAGLLAPPDIFLPALISITIGLLVFEVIRLRLSWLNRRFMACFQALVREREISTPTASTYLLVAASIVFVVYDMAIAAIALTFVAVGDPVAGMVGERWGKLKVPPETLRVSKDTESGRGLRASSAKLLCKILNCAGSPRNLRFRGVQVEGKSLTGSAACLLACLVAGAILASITQVALWLMAIGAVCATLVEFFSWPVNDNLTIPLVAGGVMMLVNLAVIA
jgi:dolichol kinase